MAACVIAPSLPTAVRAADPPNIVFVLADDLDWRSVAYMPEVKALARQGATFEAAYATTPMCVPARTTILTGKYPHNTGVRSNRPPSGGFQSFYQSGQEQETVAVWLQRAGYRTALIGKYLNYYPDTAPAMYIPPGWTRWVVPEHNRDIHAKYVYRLNEDGSSVVYGNQQRDYSTDVYASKAKWFINDSADRNKPFAVFLWLPSPHVKEVPAPRHADLFPDLRAARGSSFPELDVSDKPPFLRFPPLDQAEVASIDQRYRDRVRMLQSVDEAVGSIRDLLAERGLLANTYILFSSDHGWHQGQHNQAPGKGRAFEEDIRVPLVVRGPRVLPGRHIDRLVGNADLAPTFADWAGITPDATVDGRSLAPLLTAADPKRVPWRNRLPLMRAIEGVEPATVWPEPDLNRRVTPGYACLAGLPPSERQWPDYRGQRTERYTYVEYASGDMELYDNGRDPNQNWNQICRATSRLLEHFHRTTVALTSCRGARCRQVEDW